jgi:DNA-binding NarL/FixJ family response regulator
VPRREVGNLIRILFVEDHLILRESTRQMLEAAPDLQVVGEAAGAQEAVELGERLRPDVVLLDLNLAGQTSGVDVARRLMRSVPEAAILVLTGIEDVGLAQAALRLGIRGYLLKTVRVAELIAAIRRVRAGDIVIDAAIQAGILAQQAPPPDPTAHTARERDILTLLAAGKTYAEIGTALVVSVRTIDWHARQLRARLALPNHAALVAYAVRTLAETASGREEAHA